MQISLASTPLCSSLVLSFSRSIRVPLLQDDVLPGQRAELHPAAPARGVGLDPAAHHRGAARLAPRHVGLLPPHLLLPPAHRGEITARFNKKQPFYNIKNPSGNRDMYMHTTSSSHNHCCTWMRVCEHIITPVTGLLWLRESARESVCVCVSGCLS